MVSSGWVLLALRSSRQSMLDLWLLVWLFDETWASLLRLELLFEPSRRLLRDLVVAVVSQWDLHRSLASSFVGLCRWQDEVVSRLWPHLLNYLFFLSELVFLIRGELRRARSCGINVLRLLLTSARRPNRRLLLRLLPLQLVANLFRSYVGVVVVAVDELSLDRVLLLLDWFTVLESLHRVRKLWFVIRQLFLVAYFWKLRPWLLRILIYLFLFGCRRCC